MFHFRVSVVYTYFDVLRCHLNLCVDSDVKATETCFYLFHIFT